MKITNSSGGSQTMGRYHLVFTRMILQGLADKLWLLIVEQLTLHTILQETSVQILIL